MATRQVRDAKDSLSGELIYFKGHAQAVYMSDGSTVEDAINTIKISGGGSSDANVQAVDTGDIIDGVNANYATTEYVDGLIGDINSVLESIINGGNTSTIITFYIGPSEFQAEEGMTWREWIKSEYNTDGYLIGTNSITDSRYNTVHNPSGSATVNLDDIIVAT